MPSLLLINGPPASGKSTLASLLADEEPLTLNLDIDRVRGQLGRWFEAPNEAGLAARALAIAMARSHLRSGHSVIVPQCLAKPDFIEELETLAAEVNASFIEVSLDISRASAVEAFKKRSEEPASQSHHDATALVAASESADPVGEMYDSLAQLLKTRSNLLRLEVSRDNIPETFERLKEVLRSRGA